MGVPLAKVVERFGHPPQRRATRGLGFLPLTHNPLDLTFGIDDEH